MEINESSCLHLIGLPTPHMSIFSLVKGGKEHEVFEMRMCERGVLNSYKVTCKESEVLSWIGKHQKV